MPGVPADRAIVGSESDCVSPPPQHRKELTMQLHRHTRDELNRLPDDVRRKVLSLIDWEGTGVWEAIKILQSECGYTYGDAKYFLLTIQDGLPDYR